MPIITLRAHYDGRHIRLDEPYELTPDTPLLVTIMQPADVEHLEWLNLSLRGLADAFHEDEPVYTLGQVKERNPDYDGG
jgi:hypothetical protein